MSSINFYPDGEAQKVLEQVPFEKRNQFINDAIKGHRPEKYKSPEKYESPSEASPIITLNAELERLLGKANGLTAKQLDADSVAFMDDRQVAFTRLQTVDALDVLQSLRPPITFGEVVEMLKALGNNV